MSADSDLVNDAIKQYLDDENARSRNTGRSTDEIRDAVVEQLNGSSTRRSKVRATVISLLLKYDDMAADGTIGAVSTNQNNRFWLGPPDGRNAETTVVLESTTRSFARASVVSGKKAAEGPDSTKPAKRGRNTPVTTKADNEAIALEETSRVEDDVASNYGQLLAHIIALHDENIIDDSLFVNLVKQVAHKFE